MNEYTEIISIPRLGVVNAKMSVDFPDGHSITITLNDNTIISAVLQNKNGKQVGICKSKNIKENELAFHTKDSIYIVIPQLDINKVY